LNLGSYLAQSTWGYPIISAIHVLAMAWFGGTVLVASLEPDLRKLSRAGLGLALVSGAILFWMHPFQYYGSMSFRVKLVLLLVLAGMKRCGTASLILWAAIIFASRGIAFW
jgi:hypothetical protein